MKAFFFFLFFIELYSSAICLSCACAAACPATPASALHFFSCSAQLFRTRIIPYSPFDFQSALFPFFQTATAARAPVLLVGACGVGGCIDAYAHNARFFTAAQVPVLGLVANRGALEGFYRYDACRESLQAWFTGRRQREALLGVVPEAPDLAGARETVAAMTTAQVCMCMYVYVCVL